MQKVKWNFLIVLIFLSNMAVAIKENCDWQKTWKVLGLLGGGREAMVYNAIYVPSGDLCALKEQQKIKHFIKEVEAYVELTQKSFDGIPTIYEIWSCKSQGYITMQKLQKCLSQKATLAEVEIFIANVKEKVKEMNNKGWLHFDLHELNILCDPKTKEIKFIDFGISEKIQKGKINQFSKMYQNSRVNEMEQALRNRAIGYQSLRMQNDNSSDAEDLPRANKRVKKKKSTSKNSSSKVNEE